MLRRNLLYTAMTRAKKLCVIVGDTRAIERAIGQASDNLRHTGLARRLAQVLRQGSGELERLHAPDESPVADPTDEPASTDPPFELEAPRNPDESSAN